MNKCKKCGDFIDERFEICSECKNVNSDSNIKSSDIKKEESQEPKPFYIKHPKKAGLTAKAFGCVFAIFWFFILLPLIWSNLKLDVYAMGAIPTTIIYWVVFIGGAYIGLKIMVEIGKQLGLFSKEFSFFKKTKNNQEKPKP